MNEEIPLEVEQVQQGNQGAQADEFPIGSQGNEVSAIPQEMTNGEIREVYLLYPEL